MPLFDSLSNEDAGELIKAIMHYASSHEEPLLKGTVEGIFLCMKTQIDSDEEKYAEKCEQNAKNAKRRYEDEKAEKLFTENM